MKLQGTSGGFSPTSCAGKDPAMAIRDAGSQRLYVRDSLVAGHPIYLSADQSHYLVNVLRAKTNDAVAVFNGRDGEWLARIGTIGKRSATATPELLSRPQVLGPDIDYIFAPLKHGRLDYMVQKAAEMGVRSLRPVLTRHTIADRVNLERMRANVIEAAEQCGVLWVAEVHDLLPLTKLVENWDHGRRLIFCDEAAHGRDPVASLKNLQPGPLALIVGPEGGFDEVERQLLISKSFVVPISLGPRVMRADTAAVAALALVNATLGDWV